MGNGILQTIKQVGIFVICAQMILHFKPAESYGKYIRLLVSAMVLVQLLLPLMDLFLKSELGSVSDRIGYYQNILTEDMEDISKTCAIAEQMLNRMTMEEIKLRINNNETGIEGTSDIEATESQNDDFNKSIEIDPIERPSIEIEQ